MLSLTAASRVTEITNLDNDFLDKHHNVYIFTFSKVTLDFKVYDLDPSLCVCRTIDQYLERTRSRIGIHKQLLISLVQPYHGVTSSTVSRWIVNMLGLCGIDTKTFKAHSARSASTSKASSIGISLSEIVKRGQWQSDSTFSKILSQKYQ